MITFNIEIIAKNLADDAFRAAELLVGEIKTDSSRGNVSQAINITIAKGWHPNVIQFLDNCIYISLQQDNDHIIIQANIY